MTTLGLVHDSEERFWKAKATMDEFFEDFEEQFPDVAIAAVLSNPANTYTKRSALEDTIRILGLLTVLKLDIYRNWRSSPGG